MHLTFAAPRALFLLLALPVFYLSARRLLAATPGARLALALRLTIASLAVLALARPILTSPARELSVVFAVDGSDSLSSEERARAIAYVDQAIRGMPAGDQAGVVAVAGESAIVRPLSQSRDPVPTQPGSALPGGATDLETGLRLASSLFLPTGARRIVLLSDGQQNAGDSLAQAEQLAVQGIQIAAVPLGSLPDPEVLLDALEVAPYLRQGEPADVSITIESSRQTAATLRLWVDADLALNQQVELKVGANRFSAALPSLPKGFHALRARVDGAPDTYAQNNETFAETVVKDPARVLVVAAEPREAAPLQTLLSQAGIAVDVQSPKAIPPSFAPLQAYDGMVLVDVPAGDLSLDQMRTIQGFVESLGRGLFVVGGPNSFGAGHYDGTVLADLLPVKVKAPARVDLGQVALILVLDRSGSMDERTADGSTKIAATRDAAQLALDNLNPRDYIGVLAFDTENTWVAQPRQVGDPQSRGPIRAAIGSLEASGGTEIYQALQAAEAAIEKIPAQYKYVVLMTDGMSFSDGDYAGLTAKMRAQDVVLSTIAVGDDADKQLLSNLAQWGNGRYYYTNRASDIPKITVRETQLAEGAARVEGDIEAQVESQSPILRSLPVSLPPLKGQAAAGALDDATTALVNQRGDPILAHWQRGLGRVVAWTSDAGADWAAGWAAQPDAARVWSQAVRWSLPAPLTSGLYIRTQPQGQLLKLQVEAVDDTGALLNLLDLRASVGSGGQPIALTQAAPGRYEATLALTDQGAYPVEVAEYANGAPTGRSEQGGIVVSYPDEYRRFGPDESLLSSVVGAARGRLLTQPAQAFSRDGALFLGDDRHPLWPYLLAVALALFPFDIGVRRLRVDYTVVHRAVGTLGRALARLPLGTAGRGRP